MEMLDFDGSCRVDRDDELLARLRSVRRRADGAFILHHGGAESLWVHVNGETARMKPGFCKRSSAHRTTLLSGWSTRIGWRSAVIQGASTCAASVPARNCRQGIRDSLRSCSARRRCVSSTRP